MKINLNIEHLNKKDYENIEEFRELTDKISDIKFYLSTYQKGILDKIIDTFEETLDILEEN